LGRCVCNVASAIPRGLLSTAPTERRTVA